MNDTAEPHTSHGDPIDVSCTNPAEFAGKRVTTWSDGCTCIETWVGRMDEPAPTIYFRSVQWTTV